MNKKLLRKITRQIDAYANELSCACGHEVFLNKAFKKRDRAMATIKAALEKASHGGAQ